MNNPNRPLHNEPEDRNYYAVLLDITSRCNLKCRHCFYYRDQRSKVEDIPTDEFLARLEGLKRRYGPAVALWEGGEPMLRKDLLVQGTELFVHNIIPTNGTIKIPRLQKSIIVVSLDGPEEINDYIRGKGSFERAIRNTARAVAETDNRIHFQCTICRLNQDYIDELTEELLRGEITKLLFNFYVPVNGEKGGELAWDSNAERDPVVERVLELKRRYPDFILNTIEETERMFSDTCEQYTRNCFVIKNILPLRANLEDRMFCCYGENPDCNRCGSWGVFHYYNFIK
jgi:sulfatase maturation enzyme AslB (radical SAM superfamily)